MNRYIGQATNYLFVNYTYAIKMSFLTVKHSVLLIKLAYVRLFVSYMPINI